ncbi:hypothetical protein NLJ89_g9934 [Agrocybe chaxingu]|uniref:Uncharacterized protein n=1 Tax=Agrocybe chaxingu TaxID=84603 RepID=A0A9W8JPS4_9AGAR|nr:hypothetical protein NLJ89_g9934 [Agrocybe chaxingu]
MNPRAPLPIYNCSVEQFCTTAKTLLEEDQASFVRFALTGQHEGRQAVIDPIQDRMTPFEPITVHRDYDSLLGIDTDIRCTANLTISFIPKKEDTLTKNIHMTHVFEGPELPFSAPVHKIPNLALGGYERHTVLRVLIPGLYNEDRNSPQLTQDELKEFYELGLRPAASQLLANGAANWPASYSNEMWRARSRTGTLAFQTTMFPGWLAVYLGDYIRMFLEENGRASWARGLCFLYQIRGTKGGYEHEPTRAAAAVSLGELLEDYDFPPDQASYGKWCVDVGLEVRSVEEDCVAWQTSSHFHIFKNIARVTEYHAARVTTPGSSKYTRDLTSHLTAVSGCRIPPGPMAQGEFKVSYFQMYGTEKSVVYRPDGHHFGKYLTCEDVLKGKADNYIVNLYRVYGDAIKHNQAMARVEVRVPLDHAADVLLNLDLQLLRQSLICMDPVAFWSFKMYRAMACRLVLVWQAEGPPLYRETKPALLLTMYIVWLLNGLHSTPDLGKYNRELVAAALPHVDTANADPDILVFGTPTEDDGAESDSDDDDDGQPARPRRRADAITLPAIPFGAAQLPDLRVGEGYPVPRLCYSAGFIGDEAFHYFMKVDISEIGVEFFRKKLVVPAHPGRVRNKVHRTTTYHNDGQDPEANDFQVRGKPIQLMPAARDEGSDVDSDDNENPNNLTTPEEPAEKALTLLWRQFLLDLTLKAPNSQAAVAPSYCRLSSAERLLVNVQTYKDPNLANYFVACQWQVATDESWARTFNNLFPDENDVRAGRIQNYLQTNYYPSWAKLKAQARTSDDIKKMRKYLKVKFDTLYWMPYAQRDRIWKTAPNKNFCLFGVDHTSAPQILVRGNTPTWVVDQHARGSSVDDSE